MLKILAMPDQWNDPFDSIWLKLITILVYSIELVESVIMMAFCYYETKGLFGHYRTLINQLLSHLYGGVSISEKQAILFYEAIIKKRSFQNFHSVIGLSFSHALIAVIT